MHTFLPKDGAFYKANLHGHSTLSDGKLTPEQLRDLYRSHGYSIFAYTDHRDYHDHRNLTQPDFLPIVSFEADLTEENGKDWPYRKTYHLNFYDTCPDEYIKAKSQSLMPRCAYEDKDGINTYIAEMNRLGFLCCYNHPYWSLQDFRDYTGLEGLFAMEVYNHGCEGDGLYGAHPQVYDEMLRSGQRLFCLATDDNHNRAPIGSPYSDSFGGFTMIKAEGLSYPFVMHALKAGHFYASTGPEIHEFYMDGNTVHIACDPVTKIYLKTDTRDCYIRLAENGETVTGASFTLKGAEKYIRLECVDASGRRAYSNAYDV